MGRAGVAAADRSAVGAAAGRSVAVRSSEPYPDWSVADTVAVEAVVAGGAADTWREEADSSAPVDKVGVAAAPDRTERPAADTAATVDFDTRVVEP